MSRKTELLHVRIGFETEGNPFGARADLGNRQDEMIL